MEKNFKLNDQFCKNFRVGERCCEFECLDPPGEDNKYQVGKGQGEFTIQGVWKTQLSYFFRTLRKKISKVVYIV